MGGGSNFGVFFFRTFWKPPIYSRTLLATLLTPAKTNSKSNYLFWPPVFIGASKMYAKVMTGDGMTFKM